MSTRPGPSRAASNVIVIDSDDDDDMVGTSERATTVTLPKAGCKRGRPHDLQPSRQRSISRQAVDDSDIVDLTSVCVPSAQRVPITASSPAVPAGGRQAGHSTGMRSPHANSSPSVKRKVAVAKALQAHRKQGQQNAAMHDIQQAREVDNKPKCAVCLDDMKEPACGTCGHVFCRACLMSCIKATKKCPTCRKTLQPRTVHRIYLS